MTKREVPDMTDEQIRKAACEAYEAEKSAGGSWLDGFSAVYRAGMEAGRAEATAKPKRQKAPTCAVLRPLTVEEQTWSDWLTLRKAKKAAVTQTVLNAACREATKAGMTLEAFLQVWCYRGSQGLEAAWLTPQERSKGLAVGRIDRQLETAGLMTGASKRAPSDMGEIYDVGQQRITSR